MDYRNHLINIILLKLFLLVVMTSLIDFHTCECNELHDIVIKPLTFRKERNIKWAKGKVCYYSNHCSTFNTILRDGDVELNPGPGSHVPKCQHCNKTVRRNQKRFLCEKCITTTHAKCTNLNNRIMTSREPTLWTCNNCVHLELPFANVSDLDNTLDFENNSVIQRCSYMENLNQHRNHTSIAHLNAQSLLSTFTEFTMMLSLYKFDIVCVTETWLKNDSTQINYVQIPGYDFVYNNRTTSKGGGVGFYISEAYTYKTRSDITNVDMSIEHQWVEIKGKNKNSSFLVGCLYQPSSNENEKRQWCEKFDNLMTQVHTKWDGIIVIAGDFNIDFNSNTQSKGLYSDTLSTFNLSQHIDKPTRKNVTLIDHISSNIPEKLVNHDVIPADDISDHDLPYVILNIRKQRFEPRFKYIRNEKELDMNAYLEDISLLPFSVLYGINDPNEKLSIFNDLILNCINNHAPVRRTKFTRPPAPWMRDPNVMLKRNELNQLRQARYALQHDYREARSKYKKTLREAKSKFVKKSLSSKDPKVIWQTVRKILKPQQRRLRQDPDELNEYYANLASTITNKANKSLDSIRIHDYLPASESDNAFCIQHTNYQEVRKILSELRNDCSSGFDQIPVKYIKSATEYIISPLVHIINSCIDSELFPDSWKIARICPVPKVDNPSKVKDFRPISILPVLSKVYEKIILGQMLNFIQTQNLYNDTQCGFRKGHSTTTMLLKLRNDIRSAMNSHEITLSVLIDFSKAFDTIDHELLLKKLTKFNFSNSSIKILMSYLTNRSQFVQIDAKSSKRLPIHFGVPQGSILGPILFNLYVAELPNCTKTATIQYADDTTLYGSSKEARIPNLIKDLEQDINSLCSWSNENALVINNDKLKFVSFSKFSNTGKSYLIRSNNKSIQHTRSAKLLGMTFDENLSWTEHINNTLKSCYGTLRTLKNFKRFTPFKVRKSLAEALILSKMNYGNVVYGQLPQYMINRLQRMQISAAAYVFNRYVTMNEVLSLNWLPVMEYIHFCTVKLVQQALYSRNWPVYLNLETVQYNRNTRLSQDGLRIKHGERYSFQDQAKIFNLLPKIIREETCLSKFTSETRKFYRDKAKSRLSL